MYINLAVGWFFNDKFGIVTGKTCAHILGQLIARALMEKAKQGVTVRVLVDDINKTSLSGLGPNRLGTFAQLKEMLTSAGVYALTISCYNF